MTEQNDKSMTKWATGSENSNMEAWCNDMVSRQESLISHKAI